MHFFVLLVTADFCCYSYKEYRDICRICGIHACPWLVWAGILLRTCLQCHNSKTSVWCSFLNSSVIFLLYHYWMNCIHLYNVFCYQRFLNVCDIENVIDTENVCLLIVGHFTVELCFLFRSSAALRIQWFVFWLNFFGMSVYILCITIIYPWALSGCVVCASTTMIYITCT